MIYKNSVSIKTNRFATGVDDVGARDADTFGKKI